MLARASKTSLPELPQTQFSDRNVLPAKGRERIHAGPSHQGLLCSGFSALCGSLSFWVFFSPLDLRMKILMLLHDVLRPQLGCHLALGLWKVIAKLDSLH